MGKSNDGPILSSRLPQDKCSLNLVPNPKSSESRYIYIIFRVFLETYLLFLDKQRSIDGSVNVVVEFLWLRGRLCCVCAGLWHFETKEVLTLVSAVESVWSKSGPVAQRIRHLTTNQGIAGFHQRWGE